MTASSSRGFGRPFETACGIVPVQTFPEDRHDELRVAARAAYVLKARTWSDRQCLESCLFSRVLSLQLQL